MSETKNQKWKSVRFIFLDYAWKSLAAISIVVTLLSAFTNFDYIKAHPLKAGVILLNATVIISLVLVIRKLIFDEIASKSTLDLPREIVRYVQILYKEKNYLDVVRFASPISRFLWLSQNNKERITIGKMVEDSASKTGRLEVQVATLIDDIGWTYSAIGEHSKARENIIRGIKKAEQASLFYFAAKGERHLAGIESEVGDKNKIIEHLNNAQVFTEKITDKSEKSEMEGSLFLAKAEHFFENKNFSDAESNANLAKFTFANDFDRIVKVYSLLGNIHLAQGKYQEAKDGFNQGYSKCRNFRKDEFAKNAVGLAKVEMQANNLQNAKSYLIEAKEIYEKGTKNKELTEVKNLLQQIDNAS
ncbi:MAG: hypothetical protein KDC67_01535 [Ignavibacteriae bacterium]|nr:hypothetical protein [Ignavibacteriota bacterium]